MTIQKDGGLSAEISEKDMDLPNWVNNIAEAKKSNTIAAFRDQTRQISYLDLRLVLISTYKTFFNARPFQKNTQPATAT